MIIGYCELVNRYHLKSFSLPIQKVITYINMEPASDLTLKALAAKLNINANYLSTLFKKELGIPLTEYVNRWIQEHGVPVKPGLRELLAWLKGHGYKIALATSTYRKTASRYLELAQVSGYFPYQVFGDMVENGKPEPDIFLRAAREVETPPGQCLVLEDSYAGVEAGWRAGCPVIMVPDVLLPTEREKGRTVACVKTLHEVIPWLAEGQKKEREDGFGLQIG